MQPAAYIKDEHCRVWKNFVGVRHLNDCFTLVGTQSKGIDTGENAKKRQTPHRTIYKPREESWQVYQSKSFTRN